MKIKHMFWTVLTIIFFLALFIFINAIGSKITDVFGDLNWLLIVSGLVVFAGVMLGALKMKQIINHFK